MVLFVRSRRMVARALAVRAAVRRSLALSTALLTICSATTRALFSESGQFTLQFFDERLNAGEAVLLVIANNGHAELILPFGEVRYPELRPPPETTLSGSPRQTLLRLLLLPMTVPLTLLSDA